jgi:hypothetical protein
MRVFINNRDYLTWPREMHLTLRQQGHEVIYIDNGSTYPPLLAWYEQCERAGVRVFRLPNLGKTALWQSGIAQQQTEPYVLTDPDLNIENIPTNWPEILLAGLIQYPNISKCGLSWEERTVPPENPAYLADSFDTRPNNTSIAWVTMPDNNEKFSNYPCDTSFAVYRPNTDFYIDGIRRRHPYTGLHMPWHITLAKDASKDDGKFRIPMNDEIYYYFTHVENSSYTLERIKPMLREYRGN